VKLPCDTLARATDAEGENEGEMVLTRDERRYLFLKRQHRYPVWVTVTHQIKELSR
jgi:hypothetical protein